MMPMLTRGIQLGKDRGQGRIDAQLGGAQLLMEGTLLLMQGLPVIFGSAVALALEILELLLQVGSLCLQARIGGEGRFVGFF